MNKLLIHSNNTSFNQPEFFALPEQYVFDLPLEAQDLDIYINDELTRGGLRDLIIGADLVFIKVSLSENYLEYIGLRLAYHIRLTRSLGCKRYLPIVFIAEETHQFLGLTYSEPSILFTKGIYLINEGDYSISKALGWFREGIIKPLDDLILFVNTIQIHPPANHLSHHSIANEWSILCWAKVLGINKSTAFLGDLEQNIESLLYYKFLQEKFREEPEGNKGKFEVRGTGKVLYIDDEWNKGWNVVLGEFFKLSPKVAPHFTVLENQFKDKDDPAILQECGTRVKAVDPDIVVLDLRLSDADFETDKKPSEFTGYKVLKIIKETNPGIRVIIFTASNKVWNLIELQKAGADGFILKGSPEFGIGHVTTAENIQQFADTISEQLEYQFQKKLFEQCLQVRSFLQLQDVDENPEYKRFINKLKIQIGLIHSNIRSIELGKPVSLDIAFLACYNFMEFFKQYYIKEGDDKRYYLGFDAQELVQYEIMEGELVGRPFIPDRKYPPSWYIALAGLFVDYFRIADIDFFKDIKALKTITWSRNDYIHKGKPCFTKEELILIMDLMHKACEKIRE